MSISFTRRSLAALAAVTALSLSLPAQGLAGQSGSLKSEQKVQKRRSPTDQISVDVCTPGHADFSYEKCGDLVRGN